MLKPDNGTACVRLTDCGDPPALTAHAVRLVLVPAASCTKAAALVAFAVTVAPVMVKGALSEELSIRPKQILWPVAADKAPRRVSKRVPASDIRRLSAPTN